MKETTKTKLLRGLYITVLASFLVPIVFLVLAIIFANTDMTDRPRSEYVLMLVQCVLGAIVIHIPSLFTHKLKIDIPLPLYVLYIVFLYCAIFLGEIGSFYYHISFWDDILHGMSSIMTGFFGYMLIAILNREAPRRLHLSPFFVALFAFCFSVMIGTLWEIYEFSFDFLLGLNMQKYITEEGVYLVGQAALADTMKDLIIDSAGAAIATGVGLLSMHREGWVHGYLKNTVEPMWETDETEEKQLLLEGKK